MKISLYLTIFPLTVSLLIASSPVERVGMQNITPLRDLPCPRATNNPAPHVQRSATPVGNNGNVVNDVRSFTTPSRDRPYSSATGNSSPHVQRSPTPIPRKLNIPTGVAKRDALLLAMVCRAPIEPGTSVAGLTAEMIREREIRFHMCFYEQETALIKTLADLLIQISITEGTIKACDKELSRILDRLQIFEDTEVENPKFTKLNMLYDQVLQLAKTQTGKLKKQKEELGKIQFSLDSMREQFKHLDMSPEDAQLKVENTFDKRLAEFNSSKKEKEDKRRFEDLRRFEAQKRAQQEAELRRLEDLRRLEAQKRAQEETYARKPGQEKALTPPKNKEGKKELSKFERYRLALKRL